MKIFTLAEAEARSEEFNDDIIFAAKDPEYYDMVDPKIIEATAQELANINAGTVCGDVPNTAFASIAKMFPDILIHTLLFTDDDGYVKTISCSILIDSLEQAACIAALAYCGGGSLCDGYSTKLEEGPQWVYFESE